MTKCKDADVGQIDFAWPEPLVIDIVADRYPDIADWSERRALARLQALALREAYAGRDRHAAGARLELIAFCAARGIGPERIARVDLAVCRELAHVATTRFRTSPRTSDVVLAKLESTLSRFEAAAPAPPRQPAPFRQAAAATC